MNHNLNGKEAWVLSGGAILGAYQVGQMIALEEHGIKPDVIGGTSVGALNAMAYSFVGLDRLLSIYKNIRGIEDMLDTEPLSFLFPLRKRFNTGPLDRIVDDIVSQHSPTIPAYATRVELLTKTKEYIFSDDPQYADAVKASASIPVVMDEKLVTHVETRQRRWGRRKLLKKTVVDKVYADGGVMEMAPVTQAGVLGAKKIRAFLTYPSIETNLQEWKRGFGANLKNIGAVVNAMSKEIRENDVRLCKMKTQSELLIHRPTESLGDSFDFDPNNIESLINMGLFDMRRELELEWREQ